LKKETKLRKYLNKTSFKSQLFFIILVSFITFEIISYFTIRITINNIYTKEELNNEISLARDLAKDINNNEESFVTTLYKYQKKSNNTVLVLNNSTGGYLMDDYDTYSYTVLTDTNDKYLIPSLDVELKEENNYIFYTNKFDSEAIKTVRKIKFENNVIFDDNYSNLSDPINVKIESISAPTNLNFLYVSNNSTRESINIIENSYSRFESSTNDEVSIKYLMDINSGNIYILVKPKEIDNILNKTGEVIFIVSPFAQTKTLINNAFLSLILIIIISLAIAVLIAVFISSAFSNPIKLFEKEMLKLKENNYKKTNYGFRNKEMISLENALNEVKVSINDGVESIKKQSKKLEKLNNELINEEELRASFVQRLSHELKTPLMIISATTEALESGLIDKGDEKQSYENILNEVDKTTEIIKEIINNYKNSSDKNSLKKEMFNLNELVLEVLNPLKPLAGKNSLELITNLDNVCYISANKEMIKTVVSNYITNAFKYTPSNNKVEINIKEDEFSYTFEVINYGAHISDKNMEKIWLPFYREKEDVDSTSTGMGLYIVKTTLESHKFEYDVSNIDGGVRSYFTVKKNK